MKVIKKIKKLLPPPIQVSHGEYSMIFSSHDDLSKPTDSLISLSLQAISHAMQTDLSSLSTRLNQPPYYPDIWPGEHYKLLAGFVKTLSAKTIIEIGTATGLSALALKKHLSNDGIIHSFDLFDWDTHKETILTDKDFEDGRLVHHQADLSDDEVFKQYAPLLQKANLIFIDATHDGHLEKRLLDLFSTIKFKYKPLFIFDDIRVFTMLKMWREVRLPKLDLTSFGHWSGTGIVEAI